MGWGFQDSGFRLSLVRGAVSNPPARRHAVLIRHAGSPTYRVGSSAHICGLWRLSFN